MTLVAVALDVGGTKVAAGLIAANGRIVVEANRPAGAPDHTIEVAERLAADMLAQATRGEFEVTGIGAGYPEYVNLRGELTSREVITWKDQPLAALAKVVPGVSVAVDANVRCAARAEAALGAGKGASSFLYVSLGTGIASALVVGGEVVTGSRGEAIALGELDVPARVDRDWKGNLDAFASGTGVAARYGGASDLGAKLVEQRAREGDATARAVLESAGQALGQVLAGAVSLLDPEIVILSGGIGANNGLLSTATEKAFAAATRRRTGAAPLVRSSLGSSAGLIGAGLLAFD